jgi:V8-like Glu-specific endopeptidase
MTCSHVIKKEYIASKETLTIMDKNSREFKIKLDERFIKDFNEDLNIDAIIIEIKKEDGFDRKDFLSPDRSYEKGYDQFINKNIYLLQYPSNKPFSYSKNIIKSIDEFEFAHLASTGPGSSGSPIFLENSEFVLGIHKQGYAPNKLSVNESQINGNFIGPIVDYLKTDFEPNKIKEKNHINKKKQMK